MIKHLINKFNATENKSTVECILKQRTKEQRTRYQKYVDAVNNSRRTRNSNRLNYKAYIKLNASLRKDWRKPEFLAEYGDIFNNFKKYTDDLYFFIINRYTKSNREESNIPEQVLRTPVIFFNWVVHTVLTSYRDRIKDATFKESEEDLDLRLRTSFNHLDDEARNVAINKEIDKWLASKNDYRFHKDYRNDLEAFLVDMIFGRLYDTIGPNIHDSKYYQEIGQTLIDIYNKLEDMLYTKNKVEETIIKKEEAPTKYASAYTYIERSS